jgi:HK97 family phage major capsid protein
VLKTVKALLEERDSLRFEAKGIYDAAQAREQVGFTDEEDKRFKEITDENSGLICELDKQIKAARQREEAIVRASEEGRRKATMERLNDDLASDPIRNRRVLPTNGELPEDHSESGGRVLVRQSKLKAFKNEREAYQAGMWFRSIVSRLYNRDDKVADLYCLRHGMDISNAAYEGSGVAGGYLVPPQISQTIIDVRERVGIARQVCQIQPMTSDMVSIPKRAGGLTVYYPAELGTITDSDKNWAQIALAAQKRAVASKISQELVEDALISIVDNVVQEQAYALALQEDNELINGTGASTYGGVYGLKSAIGSAGTYTCDSNENLWAEIDLEDVMATMAKLPDRYHRSPVWLCSTNFYFAVFARLLAAAGGVGLSELQAGDGGRRSFFGVPVLTTSQMPTADSDSAIHALFGQFDMAVVLGDRTGIRMGRDDSVGFLSDYTTLKATSRYDIKVHEPGDSSNAGAYVALKTNAA